MKRFILSVLALSVVTIGQANANMYKVWNEVGTNKIVTLEDSNSGNPVYGIKESSFARGKTYLGTALSSTGIKKVMKRRMLDHCQSENGTYDIKVKVHDTKMIKGSTNRNRNFSGDVIDGYYKMDIKAAVFSCVE